MEELKKKKRGPKPKAFMSPIAVAEEAKERAEAVEAKNKDLVGKAVSVLEKRVEDKKDGIATAAELAADEKQEDEKASIKRIRDEGIREGVKQGIAEGKKLGFIEGREAGYVQGRREGYPQAFAEGRQNGKKQIVMSIEKQLSKLDGYNTVQEWVKGGKLPAYWIVVLMECWEPREIVNLIDDRQ